MKTRGRIDPAPRRTLGGLDGYFFLSAVLLPLEPLTIRKSLVPQTGHFPSFALRPFFMVTSFMSSISRFSRHFTQ
jgi:hypothetical protein